MTLYVTSDLHLWHSNIIRLCDRPFRDVEHMNNEIVKRFNEVLTPDDVLLNLGDVVMGKRAETLPTVKDIKVGKHILFPGNHDNCWIGNPSEANRAKMMPLYQAVFDGVYELPILSITDDTQPLNEFGIHPVLA